MFALSYPSTMVQNNINLQLGNSLDSLILQTLYELKLLGFKEVNESLVANILGCMWSTFISH